MHVLRLRDCTEFGPALRHAEHVSHIDAIDSIDFQMGEIHPTQMNST